MIHPILKLSDIFVYIEASHVCVLTSCLDMVYTCGYLIVQKKWTINFALEIPNKIVKYSILNDWVYVVLSLAIIQLAIAHFLFLLLRKSLCLYYVGEAEVDSLTPHPSRGEALDWYGSMEGFHLVWVATELTTEATLLSSMATAATPHPRLRLRPRWACSKVPASAIPSICIPHVSSHMLYGL